MNTIVRAAIAATSAWTMSVLAMEAVQAQNWPSFRGDGASGVAAKATPPVSWNVGSSQHVAWSTPIPGLAHSSPVVWGDRVFLTTAVAPAGTYTDAELSAVSPNLNPARDMVKTEWKLYSLDRRTGRVLWERTVHEGVPRVKRHEKASHASATPVTNGTYVVAAMGSEGVYCFDMKGTLQWTQDLGMIDVGLARDLSSQWGAASSPIILDDVVIVQNDRQPQTGSFLIAFDLRTGKERWRVKRDELPAWATPAVHRGASRTTIVTNASRYIRGYDARDGREVWQVADAQATAKPDNADSQVKVPTPVIAGDLAIVTGGYPSAARPIFAIRVADGTVAWKLDRGSPYTSTPLVYEDLLYVMTDNGVLGAYELRTGERVYQRRIAESAGGFSASPVAADGHLYFASEDGIVYVVKAGRTFELLASNDMREVCMATPAISNDLLIVRTRSRVYALSTATAGSGRSGLGQDLLPRQ